VFLVVGLGNPGKKYEKNRHNIGFLVAESIRDDKRLPEWKDKFSGSFSRGETLSRSSSESQALAGSSSESQALAVLCPQTFMNLSGDCVQPAQAFLKVAPREIIVVHDELDIPFGRVAIKVGGGHAGHNGLRSIIARLGTPDFVRVRVGVGRPPADFKGDVADFVLADFSGAERGEIDSLVTRSREAVYEIIDRGVDAAMTRLNQDPSKANALRDPRRGKK
jgi:PTH1 family peptidyl-tRNA hydrolase